jgi:hypothetical protein
MTLCSPDPVTEQEKFSELHLGPPYDHLAPHLQIVRLALRLLGSPHRSAAIGK